MTVPPKEIPAANVVAIVVLIAPILTGTTLVTVNEAALIAVALLDPRVTEPAPASEETVRAPRGVRAVPTLSKIEITPPVPEFKVSLFIFDMVPLMVLLKVIAAPAEEAPAKVVSIVVSAVFNVDRPYVVTAPPDVVIFPAMVTDGLLGTVVEDP